MDRKMKTSILIAAGACLTITFIVIGVVVSILVKNQAANQLAIQESADKSVIDMAAASRKTR